ncbi:MAG: hypothetical protein KF893_02090 [Caldilineaceae bacterium]|nr:hypothetical protein [Caldilineaceae bacterium]
MAEDRRHDAEETPAEAATAAPAESPAPSSSIAVAPLPESPVQTPAETPVETQTQAEIDLDNLRERDDVLPMESVPPADQQSDMPADLEELRQASSTPRPRIVDNERRYGPLSGSMWFLVIAIFAFVLTLIFRLLG